MGSQNTPVLPQLLRPLSLAYVEDNVPTLEMNLGLFKAGLNAFPTQDDLVICRGFDEYGPLWEEVKNGHFPDVLITDNEVNYDEGVEEAPRIYDLARQAGHEMLVVSLLASNIGFLTREQRRELALRDIATLNKTTQTVLCARYIGRCVQEGHMNYVTFTGLEHVRPDDSRQETKWQAVQNALLPASMDGALNPATWYLTLADFLENHRDILLDYMSKKEGERIIADLIAELKPPVPGIEYR